ncbi:hypothetical protein JOD31_003032 [Methylopila capsulata]|uniref:Uncharacterized protein n=1 Tax=Methylopila capsulata TaxID=61654 RepID=A0A9W6IXK8_9HYPH|nr:hypothetical protein [Methylopila capsulata]MBM7852790.1 hypothetical protein [Methylopila capsulata]GLK57000.1 hypothetical protein GCM10008170_30190 [Methylopila capsulata]
MAIAPEDAERRIRAKRINERLKLLAGSVNTVGLTVLGAAVLVPFIGGTFTPAALVWILLAVGLHSVAQVLLSWLRSED